MDLNRDSGKEEGTPDLSLEEEEEWIMEAVRDGAPAETVTAHPPSQRAQQDPWRSGLDLPPHKVPALAAWQSAAAPGRSD